MEANYKGLTTSEVEARIKEYGLNALLQHAEKTTLSVLLEIVKEPMIALLIIGGLLYVLLGDISEAIMLFVMIGCVLTIEFFQEKRTEKALSSLKALSAPKCRVIREGNEIIVQSRDIVPGDIIRVLEGERIPADSEILESDNLNVDESALTGESLPVAKSAINNSNNNGLTKTNWIYSSTLIKSGWVIGKVHHTGKHSQIGKIGSSLEAITEQPTRIQKETKILVKYAAILGIGISIVVVVGMGLQTGDWLKGLLQGIAIAMSMLPEEFPVVLTIFMALGAAKIAKKHVLMRHMPALETLGSATVLCVDKTGTLTKNKMELTAVSAGKAFIPIDDISFSEKDVIRIARLACQVHHDDPMEKEISAAASKLKIIDQPYQLIKHIPLQPPHLYMINIWQAGNSKYIACAKGAPESILELCSSSETIKQHAELKTYINDQASLGKRVLAVAESGFVDDWSDDTPFHFCGLLAFEDPIRDQVPQAISLCHKAGIKTMMITGDYIETAQAIGRRLGLSGVDLAITGQELYEKTSTEIKHALQATSVCARIMPEQKLQIVKALQENGQIVAMTGDGINDAPALKAANMGIAMGKRGTDVAREAADMILMDDSFLSIVAAIKEGRHIFDNIQKAIGFVLAIHLPIALMAVVPVLFGLPPLLMPVHVVILELIIDPTCTLVFESEKMDDNVMDRPPRNPHHKIFNTATWLRSGFYGLVISCSVFAAYCIGRFTTLDADVLRTMAFITLLVANIIIIASTRSSDSIQHILKRPNNAFWIVTSSVWLFLIAAINIDTVRSIMKLSYISNYQLGIIACIALVALITIEMVKRSSSVSHLLHQV